MIRARLKQVVNGALGLAGLRLVSSGWGPRGFEAAFATVRARGFSPGTVVDVGASDGYWTRECRRIFPDADYLLVDPLEENREALDAYARVTPRVTVWHGALGAATGNFKLHAHGDQSSFLDSSDFSGPVRTVPVRRLDDLLATLPTREPLLVKADVQGFELQVLAGGEAALERTGLLLLEVSFVPLYHDAPLADEVIAWLGGRGFRVLDVCSYVQRPGDRQLAQADLLFAPAGSPLFGRDGWLP